MKAIETLGLVKKFGTFTALDNLSISVPSGSVFGFLGPNGAGKTTVLRILTGLARPTSGRANISGVDVTKDSQTIKGKIGYLPETPAFYGWMNAREYLGFCADLFGLVGETRRSRLKNLLDFAGLSGNDRPVAGYSRGMRQRLGIAQAMINDPEILLLDEPTSALDPMGRKEVLDMIDGLGQEKTVFLSTHILADVERICDRVAMLNKGRLVLEADLQTLKAKYVEPIIDLEIGHPSDRLVEQLTSANWAGDVKTSGRTIVLKAKDLGEAQRALPKLLADLSIPLHRLEVREPSLEDIFMKIMA